MQIEDCQLTVGGSSHVSLEQFQLTNPNLMRDSQSSVRDSQFAIPERFLTMNRIELERRTKQFAIRIIEFAATLPKSGSGRVVEYQLVKAGTSVGANYREAGRAESRNDFIHKIGIVEKEASESRYWLEICAESSLETNKSAVGYCGRQMSSSRFSPAQAGRQRLAGEDCGCELRTSACELILNWCDIKFASCSMQWFHV